MRLAWSGIPANLVGLAILTPLAVLPAQPPPLVAGQRMRVTMHSAGLERDVVTLLRLRRDTIEVYSPRLLGRFSRPLADVTSVEVPVPGGGHVGRSALIGAAVGFFVGGAIGASVVNPHGFIAIDRGAGFGLGAVGGGALGALIGAAIGALVPRPWEPVPLGPLHQLEVSLTRVVGGGVGLQWSARRIGRAPTP